MSNAFNRLSNASLVDSERLPPPPKGHVWVEWVGEASALDNPVVRYNLLMNRYTPEQRRVIKELSRVRIARVHRHTRTLRRGNGLGQLPSLGVEFVRFGPNVKARPGEIGSFIQAVPFKAADTIKASGSGHEFVIHNERDGEQINHIHIGEVGLRTDTRTAFGDFETFRKEMRW